VVEVVLLIELNPNIPFVTKFEKDLGPLIEVKGQNVLKGLKRGGFRIYLVIAIKV
jgi:hypothetical protein